MEGADARKMRLKVFVRVRPPPSDESSSIVKAEHRVLYLKDAAKGQSSEYVFDKVFDGNAKQDAVFHDVGMPLIDHVLQGYNACCFAYGQTGSGKTYSMYGRDGANASNGGGAQEQSSDPGLIPRACEALWKTAYQVNRKADHVESAGGTPSVRIKLFVSFLDIYMEQVRDLGAAAQAYLKANGIVKPGSGSSSNGGGGGGGGGSFSGSGFSHNFNDAAVYLPPFTFVSGSQPPSRAASSSLVPPSADPPRINLEVVEDANGNTYAKDLSYIEVASCEEMLAILRAGYGMRPAAVSPATGDVTYRSHTVFTVTVVTYRAGQQPVTGRLNLVDLAGSERHGRSGSEAQRLKELSFASKSLAALGKVVTILAHGAPHIPLPSMPSVSSGSGASPSGSLSLASAPHSASHSISHASHASASHSASVGSAAGGGGSTSSSSLVHIPFRDSKLTRLLKDSLTGNALVALLACLLPIPENVEECTATLQYAVRCSAPSVTPAVNVVPTVAPDAGAVEELMKEVTQLKDELEVTHAHYQKLLEQVAGPAWRGDPGPLERAPGAEEAGLDAFAAALANLGKPSGERSGSGSGSAMPTIAFGGISGGGGSLSGGLGSGGGREGSADERRRSSAFGDRSVGGAASVVRGGGMPKSLAQQSASGANSRISFLEAQVRKLEAQLGQARTSAQQYEERLTARKEEMDMVRERMAGKEHAQFAEIKKLRAQVAELTKALDAERTDSASKLEDARRRSEEECSRLLKDIEALRGQLAAVTGSVSGLVAKHSAAITAEKRQREAVRRQADQLLQQQVSRGSEEHKAQLENLKQQSGYFLGKQAEQLADLRHQLEAGRAAQAAEREALMTELDYLASYCERVTELVRRMESGVVPVHERGNGVRAFRLPQRDRPPRLEGSRLTVLKERSADLYERLLALSAAAAAGTGRPGSPGGLLHGCASSSSLHSPSPATGTSGGGAGSGGPPASPTAATSPGRNSHHAHYTSLGGGATGGGGSSLGGGGGGPLGPALGGLGGSVDLDALRAQVESELKAAVTAQVVGDMRSDKTIQYIRELEVAVGRYRSELQAEKKRSSEMAIALRSVQRLHQRPESPINKALAAHTPSGTIKLAPSWGMGHTPHSAHTQHTQRSAGGGGSLALTGASRPATAGLGSLAEGSLASGGTSFARRPSTSMAALTSGFRENGLAVP
ncbi:hypothetical protein Agub_g9726 [Astrephomene gubernaculifera]|uniref:Kinesin motor domain-containing protein n=1 Tax=Astrephomene gubernaculifera TaxID=47775 RepID=A0AAD3DTN1_9CHLO|nr:hypothetical protein Agub_g9726 [Astrephomene gubernaculifera]